MTRKPRLLMLVALVIGPGWLQAFPVSGNEGLCEKNAAALARAGKVDAGLAAIRQCIADNPAQAKAHVVLGHLLLDQGDAPQAMAAFERALALEPRSSAARTGKGIVLARNGDLRGAESMLKEALQLNPDPARTHYELGLVYERLGDLQAALVHFKQGISAFEQEKGRQP